MSRIEPFIGCCIVCLHFALTNYIMVSEYFYLWFNYAPITQPIECYSNSLFDNKLANLNSSSVRVNNSIFFLETNCHERKLKMPVRQACAVESAARLNPNRDILLLLPSTLKNAIDFEPHIEALFSYTNFRLRHINMDTYFEGTPLESWWRKGYLNRSSWPTPHASDILRYVTLWKYGGVYSDLDVIFVKSLGNLMNFVGYEGMHILGSSIMSLSQKHHIANLCLEDICEDYQWYTYSNTGPLLVTRVLRQYCGVYDVEEMNETSCRGFKILPFTAFYPIPWYDWETYFLASELKIVKKLINDSYAVHFWNHFSSDTKVVVGSQQPYAVLAKTYCPKVYSSLNKTI